MNSNKPNVYLLGSQKSGTTALFDWLSQHPDIFAPSLSKDFHYFSSERLFSQGEKSLLELYEGHENQKVILHGVANYLYFEKSFARIKAFAPSDSKFVVVLRDPVKRAYSAYQYFYKLGKEDLSFEDAIAKEQRGGFNEDQLADFTYIEHGNYYQQIQAFAKFFDLNKLHVIIFEEFLANKDAEMERLLRFLEVDPTFKPQYSVINYTGEARFRFINRIIFRENSFRQTLRLLVPKSIRLSLAKFLANKNVKNTKSAKIERDIYDRTSKYFTKETEALSALLNKDLSQFWKY